MDFVGQLWLPILVATVLCFIASAVIWMAGPHHKKEWPGLPNQDVVLKALRESNPPAGSYMVPYADRGDKAAFEAMMKEWAVGPAGVVYIFPRGPMNMGKMLGLQFAFFLLVNVCLAAIGNRTGLDNTSYQHVFKVIGVIAFMAHLFASIPESIWFARPWKNVAMQAVDAAIYAGLTAGAFGWLWPRVM